MKRSLLFIIFISLFIPSIYAQEYGEDSDGLGQFVDDFENLDNVTVIVDLVRNATLNAIELDGTEYIEYVQFPFQLREHDCYVGYDPQVWWGFGADLRMYTNNAPRGDGWMFVNVDASWLEGKYIRLEWFTVGSLINRPMYFRVYDGSYNRSSMTDFPTDNPILIKGAGKLYEYREPDFNAWRTRDFLMDLDTWGHTLDTVMIAVYLWDNYQWYTRAYLDWVEFNEGAGGADNIFTLDLDSGTENYVIEVTGTTDDYGYINDTKLPYTGGGYFETGYLITDDYLNYTTGSSLVLLTNTTMPYDTSITIEFSEDNSSWAFNDWEPIFGGFEAVDLRILNYSDIYIRYNFTGTLTETPRLYQSRLVTTWVNVTGGGGSVINIYGINSATILMLILLCALAGLIYVGVKKK